MKHTYLVKYSFRTCHADEGSKAWAKVVTDQEIADIFDFVILKNNILVQRGDEASIFIEDFKLVN